MGKDVRNITLKGKFQTLKANTEVPGPGTYDEITSIPRTGRNFQSKYRSISNGNIGPPTKDRFKDASMRNNYIPGPGQYTPKTEFANTGQYFLSKFKSSGTAVLAGSKRNPIKKVDAGGPGPGSYILPSDFGYPSSWFDRNAKKRKRGVRSSSQL
mmetsp:Transcript_22215/g.24689  ORF Transcript_22215/g.24689 Transcript_22215/m.24689 type:complete len:155 (+) Transcript_22215:409-873(+)